MSYVKNQPTFTSPLHGEARAPFSVGDTIAFRGLYEWEIGTVLELSGPEAPEPGVKVKGGWVKINNVFSPPVLVKRARVAPEDACEEDTATETTMSEGQQDTLVAEQLTQHLRISVVGGTRIGTHCAPGEPCDVPPIATVTRTSAIESRGATKHFDVTTIDAHGGQRSYQVKITRLLHRGDKGMNDD